MAKILVVEDDTSMNEILVTTLQDDEHEVKSAFSGPEAIELCQQLSFDLVITDVRLPGTDGVDTIPALKSLQPNLKFIVITGYASEDTPVRAIRLNVDDYLFKPFSLKYFLNSVHRVLEQEEERKSKRALFGKLFARFGMSMGDDNDDKLVALVGERQEAFRGLFVGTRSGYLSQAAANFIYSALEAIENKFRRLLNAKEPFESDLEKMRLSYADIHERLALAQIGAEEDAPNMKPIPSDQFRPLYEAIKDSGISFGELLYAPLLRKTPDARFETLTELLELKRKLWPLA